MGHRVRVCLIFACVLACGLTPATASAGVLREVSVRVVNDSGRFAYIKVFEAGVSRIFERWHETKALVGLPPGQDIVVSSGKYDQRTLAIADAPSSRCGNRAEGLLFSNPVIGDPLVGEARQASGGSWSVQGPYPRTKSFGEGGKLEFWDKAVQVTRHQDSRDYIEFTERILRQQCQ